MSTEQTEQKADPRYKARFAIFSGPDQRGIVSNYSVNMSTGGMFIETDNILPVDTQLTMKFNLPGNDAIISCTVRVAWTNEPGNQLKLSLPPGMGLQFVDLSLHDLYLIRDYLQKGDLTPIW